MAAVGTGPRKTGRQARVSQALESRGGGGLGSIGTLEAGRGQELLKGTTFVRQRVWYHASQERHQRIASSGR